VIISTGLEILMKKFSEQKVSEHSTKTKDLQIWDLETTIFSDSKSFKWYHVTTNNYGTSFFVGIAFRYLFRKKILFTKIQEIIFWILPALMMTGVLLWHNTFFRLDKSAPLLSVLLWHSIRKLLFCLGFAWILYARCIGRGGLYLFFAFIEKMSSKNSVQNFFLSIYKQFMAKLHYPDPTSKSMPIDSSHRVEFSDTPYWGSPG
jgi:hypothetical protein